MHNWSNIVPSGSFLNLYSGQTQSLNTNYGFSESAFDIAVPTTVYNAASLSQTDIQSAINLASSSGGGIVKLPAGTGNFSTPIVLQSKVMLEGAGAGVTILKYTGNSTTGAITATDKINIVVRDLTLNCDGRPTYGLNFEACDNVLAERLEIYLAKNGNLRFRHVDGFTARFNELYNCLQYHGIAIKDVFENGALRDCQYAKNQYAGKTYGNYYTTNGSIYSNDIYGCGGNGLNLHLANSEIAGNNLHNNAFGSKFYDGSNLLIHNNLFKDNTGRGTGTYATYNCPEKGLGNVTLCNNRFDGNGSTDIGIYGTGAYGSICQYMTGPYILNNNTYTNNPGTNISNTCTASVLHICSGSTDLGANISGPYTIVNNCTDCSDVCDVEFSGTPLTGTTPLAVSFNNLSGGGSTWKWEYSTDNGNTWTQFSTLQNPPAQLLGIGTYSIRLTVDDTCNLVKQNYITVYGTGTGSDCENSILLNGDFATNDLTNWTFFTNGTSTADASTGEFVLEMNVNSTNTQLYQSGLGVTAGDQMILCFDAYADQPVNMPVALIQHNSPFNGLGLGSTIALSSSVQSFCIPFTVSATETDARLRFVFNGMPDNIGNVYIDNICLGEDNQVNTGTITAVINSSAVSGNVPLTVTLNAVDSISSGAITDYEWSYSADGGDTFTVFSTAINTSIEFTEPGTYNIKLVIAGIAGSAEELIVVEVLDVPIATEPLPLINGKYNIDSVGTVTSLSSHPSWADLFISRGQNLLGMVHVSYNVFTGLGQGIEPCTNTIILFNIDTGQYTLYNCDGTELSSGVDSRLSVYGLAHPVSVAYGGNRGQGYWDWYQNEQNTLYGVVPQAWPTFFEEQYNAANNI